MIRPSPRVRIGLGVMLAIVAVLLANAHLVWVAVSSQPDCVAHVRDGDPDRPDGSYMAAKSSC
jgi:hypothetical protein